MLKNLEELEIGKFVLDRKIQDFLGFREVDVTVIQITVEDMMEFVNKLLKFENLGFLSFKYQSFIGDQQILNRLGPVNHGNFNLNGEFSRWLVQIPNSNKLLEISHYPGRKKFDLRFVTIESVLERMRVMN
ncbi:hypothetical protein B9Z55_026828 [Caenorhabditis nigoni]|uniref:DUF38 domain-containing protein n=1 Tax=Caenorhabditis nigoni TaxID=1611254 RepID=A0A2G5SHM9_9PELO|nr:hypothetical protein B9Z55_026828 [Caenorhabditis nigoni]